ncbi:FPL domain-containing protein [Entamoeba marina]
MQITPPSPPHFDVNKIIEQILDHNTLSITKCRLLSTLTSVNDTQMSMLFRAFKLEKSDLVSQSFISFFVSNPSFSLVELLMQSIHFGAENEQCVILFVTLLSTSIAKDLFGIKIITIDDFFYYFLRKYIVFNSENFSKITKCCYILILEKLSLDAFTFLNAIIAIADSDILFNIFNLDITHLIKSTILSAISTPCLDFIELLFLKYPNQQQLINFIKKEDLPDFFLEAYLIDSSHNIFYFILSFFEFPMTITTQIVLKIRSIEPKHIPLLHSFMNVLPLDILSKCIPPLLSTFPSDVHLSQMLIELLVFLKSQSLTFSIAHIIPDILNFCLNTTQSKPLIIVFEEMYFFDLLRNNIVSLLLQLSDFDFIIKLLQLSYFKNLPLNNQFIPITLTSLQENINQTTAIALFFLSCYSTPILSVDKISLIHPTDDLGICLLASLCAYFSIPPPITLSNIDIIHPDVPFSQNFSFHFIIFLLDNKNCLNFNKFHSKLISIVRSFVVSQQLLQLDDLQKNLFRSTFVEFISRLDPTLNTVIDFEMLCEVTHILYIS